MAYDVWFRIQDEQEPLHFHNQYNPPSEVKNDESAFGSNTARLQTFDNQNPTLYGRKRFTKKAAECLPNEQSLTNPFVSIVVDKETKRMWRQRGKAKMEHTDDVEHFNLMPLGSANLFKVMSILAHDRIMISPAVYIGWIT